MKILWGLPGTGWEAACSRLHHELVTIDRDRPTDTFRRHADTDIIVASLSQAKWEPYAKFLRSFTGKFVLLYERGTDADLPRQYDLFLDTLYDSKLPNTLYWGPSAPLPPDFTPPAPSPEFTCDVVCVEPDAILAHYLIPIAQSGLRLKVFGRERVGVPQYIGELHPEQIGTALASAKLVIDLSRDPESTIVALATNGYVATTPDNPLANDCFAVIPDGNLFQLLDALSSTGPLDTFARKTVVNKYSRDARLTQLFASLEV